MRVGEGVAAIAVGKDGIAIASGRDVCCFGTADPAEYATVSHSASR